MKPLTKEGFYYTMNYMGSVTIMEVLKHEGVLMVARAGRNKMIPLSKCGDGLFIGPIPVPPSCCYAQSDLAKIAHWGNTEISIPVPLLCSFVMQTVWWSIRQMLRHALATSRHCLGLLPLSSASLPNAKEDHGGTPLISPSCSPSSD